MGITGARSVADMESAGLPDDLQQVPSPEAPQRRSWTYRMLDDRALTIAGGTSEVQRGVIAQRVLGLPR